jgi:tetratricopeptide (TPR) repeat protein
VTATGAVLGTPSYMAPEQAEGKATVGPAADVYALGAILYECLTGRPPFKAAFALDTLRQVLEEEPVAVRALQPGVPRDLETICHKCLEKDPARRYATAAALADDLCAHLDGRPIAARPVGRGERAWRWCRRNPVGAALVAALAAGVLASTGLTLWALGERDRARAAEQDAVAEAHRAVRAEADAVREKNRAVRAEADTGAFSTFLVDHVLAAARPVHVQKGLGINVTVADALAHAEPFLAQVFAGQPRAEATARHALGVTWRQLNRYAQAEDHLRRALDLRERALGADADDTLTTRHSLGVLLNEAGKLPEAITVLEEVTTQRTRKGGTDHASTLASLRSLGAAYLDAGRFAAAARALEQVRERGAASVGVEHPTVVQATFALAAAYERLGRADEGAKLVRAQRERLATHLGPAYTPTPEAELVRSGEVVRAGRFDEAIAVVTRVHDTYLAERGPNHRDTLTAARCLALAYSLAGRQAPAIPLFEHALEHYGRLLGPNHAETLVILNGLGTAYWKAKQPDKAIPLFMEELRRRRAVSGDDDPNVVRTAFNIAVNCREGGQLDEAVRLYDEWLPRQLAQFGWDHSLTALRVSQAVLAYERTGRITRALALARDLLAGQRAPTADRQRFADALESLGGLLLRTGQAAEAEGLLRERLALGERESGAVKAWGSARGRSLLGAALAAQHKYAEAEPHLLAAYAFMKQRAAAKGAAPPPPGALANIPEALERIIQLYESWEKPDEAAKWRRERDALQPPPATPKQAQP